MKVAMKAREKETLATIRLILAELKRVEVDERMVRRPHALAPRSPIGARPRARIRDDGRYGGVHG